MESIIKKLGKTSVTVEKDYHSSEKEYNKLTIVEEEGTFKTYLSRKPVPVGIALTNREYWICFSGVLESITFDYLKFKKDYASGKVIEDNAIITRHILDRNIERIKIALKAISEEEIDDDAVIERTIKDRNVTSNKIAKENILTEHFAKKSVITTILADYAITSIKLADDSVTTRSIVNENITQEKLAKNSVTESKIANNAININKFDSYTRNIIESVKYIPKEFTSLKEAIFDEINKYKPIIINGDVTNAADEEDITSENNLLKLKDRSALNGMGYIILRKNKSFAEQVTKENTIYEIRYDFDLNGQEITIPEGCILKFNGGSIKGGNITGHILNSYVMPQWFGAIEGDNVIDGTQNNEAFQNCVNICDNICVPAGTYIFKQITGNENGGSFRIEKNNTKLFSAEGATLKFEQNDYNGMTFQSGMVIINNCSDIVIDNIVFEGDELVQTDNSDHNGIIYMVGSTNVSIQNCKFFNVSKDAIFIILSKNVKIDNCIIDTIHRDGMVVDSVDGLLVKNVEITNVRDTTYSFAVDIETHHEGRIIKDVIFKDCNFHNIQQNYAIISSSPIVGKCLIDGGYYVGIQVNKDSEDVKIRNITANGITAKGKIDISNSIIEILNFENKNDENKSSIISNCNIGKLQCSTGASTNYNAYFNNCVFNMINMSYTTPNKISFIYCIFQNVTEGLNFVANSFIEMYSCLYKSNLEINKNIAITSNDGIEVVGCSFVFSETTQSQGNIGAVMLNSKKVFFENNNISMPKNLNPIYMLNVTQNHNNGGTVTLLNNVFSGLKRHLFSTYGLNNMTLGQTRVLANNTFKDDYINEDLSPQ